MEEDSCSLYNPAKSLMQQFSASNRLALSHPESLSLSELPGADHQNRLCFHFPFQITGDTYDSGKSFAPHPPSDAIPCPDTDCLVLSWTPGELLVALGSRLPWCHSHAGPGEGAEKDNGSFYFILFFSNYIFLEVHLSFFMLQFFLYFSHPGSPFCIAQTLAIGCLSVNF